MKFVILFFGRKKQEEEGGEPSVFHERNVT